MKNAAFWVIAIVAVLWSLFGFYDLYMTLIHDPGYLAHFPPELIAMIDGFPEWRRLLWIVGVFLGIIAAFLLLLRRSMAERVFWATVAAMAIGFGYDLLIADGMAGYGTEGAVMSVIIIGVQVLFALYARWAARHGMLR